jgi:16S rRNA processing protein RimM
MAEYPEYSVDIAVVLKAHGVRGQLKAACYSDVVDRLATVQEVCIRPRVGLPFLSRVAEARQLPHRPVYIVRLAGVDDRDQAQTLVGASISIPSGQSPALPDGTYYVADIVGLRVVTGDGEILGRIVEVIRTGANDVYQLDSGLLIPGIADVVREVDIAAGEMLITPLPGMFE